MFHKPNRRHIIEPQLAAMVDVFSILIIFLIAGTVMGSTAVVLPAGLVPPKSASKESMLMAPQLTVHQSQVQLSFSAQTYPLAAFLNNSDPASVTRFKAEVQGYIERNKTRPDSDAINFVADQGMTYNHIFAVIKAAREAGIKAILFISLTEAAHD